MKLSSCTCCCFAFSWVTPSCWLAVLSLSMSRRSALSGVLTAAKDCPRMAHLSPGHAGDHYWTSLLDCCCTAAVAAVRRHFDASTRHLFCCMHRNVFQHLLHDATHAIYCGAAGLHQTTDACMSPHGVHIFAAPCQHSYMHLYVLTCR